MYTFGDAVNDGQPGPQSSRITSAAAVTPNGGGYWILNAAGPVFPFGKAAPCGGCPSVRREASIRPTSAIFTTSDGGGCWIVTALSGVSSYGDSPDDGDMSGPHRNGPIVAASGS